MASADLKGLIDELPWWQRQLILIGGGMTGSVRGIQQLLNQAGIKSDTLGSNDESIKGILTDQRSIDALREETPGSLLGDLIGSAADPISLAAGGVATAPLKSLLARGAASGAVGGVLGEVEEGGSRLGNTAMGLGMGALTSKMPNKKDLIYIGEKAKGLSERQKAILAGVEAPEPLEGFKGYAAPGKKNNMRLILDDSRASFDESTMDDTPQLLSWVVRNPKLFKHYPELKDVGFRGEISEGAKVGGGFNPRDSSIEATATNAKEMMEVLTHEIQHAIQKIEGWPRGGNEKAITADLLNGYMDVFNIRGGYLNPQNIQGVLSDPASIKARAENLMQHAFSVDKNTSPYSKYLRLAGEIEARDAAARKYHGIFDVQPGEEYLYNPSVILRRIQKWPEAVDRFPDIDVLTKMHRNPIFAESLDDPLWMFRQKLPF